MKFKNCLFAVVFSILGASQAQANGFDRCNQSFYNNTPPQVGNPKMAQLNFPLCFPTFAVNYSGVAKNPIYSAELLTYQHLVDAKSVSRVDNFREDQRIPLKYRSLLSDYRGSGMDRGHLSPAGDRKDADDKDQSFILSNIVPQASYSNQEGWRLIEEAARSMVLKTKQPAYVITGGLYLGKKLRTVGNNVFVPTHTYKVILFPTTGVVGAWVAVNDDSGRLDVVSVAELQRFSGMTFFPTLRDTRPLNYRYMLPLNSKQANKMSAITVSSDNQNSEIFSYMPDKNIKQKASRNPNEDNYKKNREELKQMGSSYSHDVMDAGIGLIKDVLR
ncbi:DNA/RNA non-specific endonuclease [Acinetobacter sp. P1(2025)]|uniref:DNA/RNA non-specific endonuclease n=1 Tax=Acinetobacter sp. P1(2025) TaxID=3446120 RepID=UPI003F5376DD